jgi:hypothetical protein
MTFETPDATPQHPSDRARTCVDQVWFGAPAGQREHVEQIAREYPRQPRESGYHYVVRLALEAGLISDGEGVKRFPAADVPAWTAPARPMPVDVRMPFREPGEDDE